MKTLWKIVFRTGLVLFVIGLGLLGYVFLVEPGQLKVNQYEIRLKKWDKQLDGLRVVMISDLHAGANFINESKIRTIVQKANEQDADLIVLLGDFVAQNHFDRSQLKMPLKKMVDNLQGLKARYGVFFVLGNHDNEHGSDVVKKEVERTGYRIFDDRTELIKTEKGEFWLAGLRDILKFKSRREYSDYAKSVIKDIKTPDAKIIVLTHNPDSAMMITDNREGQYKMSDNIVLMLAGHTHGGQVQIPFYGSPMVPSSFGYTRGHIVESGLDMFITSGVGTSILPVRFSVPPEIAVVTIVSEQN